MGRDSCCPVGMSFRILIANVVWLLISVFDFIAVEPVIILVCMYQIYRQRGSF